MRRRGYMIDVLAITGKSNEPSSRFRIRQHTDSLLKYEISVHDYSARFFGRFPPKNKAIRPCWALGNMLEHIPSVIKSFSNDVVWLQREFLSTYFTLERFLKCPIVLDVDDAIFVHRNGKAASSLAYNSNAVICGNQYLAEYFFKYNNNVHIIPTAVDANIYCPVVNIESDKKILVWSGSSSGLKFLYAIEKAINLVMLTSSNIILRVISDQAPNFSIINYSNVEYIEWTPENEVHSIQTATIGLMPLNDDAFTQGKCSYKMLTYMSCGIPVIVSPVGMNAEVLNMDDVGFGASSEEDWVETLLFLLKNPQTCKDQGNKGRNIIHKHFDKPIVSAKIANVFQSMI